MPQRGAKEMQRCMASWSAGKDENVVNELSRERESERK
jgi:hypothetical protein